MWLHRSELGQRALGARSILADPRIESNRQFINEHVKEREWYRPLAPSVLVEHVNEWFEPVRDADEGSSQNPFNPFNPPSTTAILSPYMSVTARIRDQYQSRVPAVCHIDNTARLQTVSNPNTNTDSSNIKDPNTFLKMSEQSLYYQLITRFFQRTSVPMVLNTSFNLKGQPIVETPAQAIQSYLQCRGTLSTLYIGEWKVTLKPFPISISDDVKDTNCK